MQMMENNGDYGEALRKQKVVLKCNYNSRLAFGFHTDSLSAA